MFSCSSDLQQQPFASSVLVAIMPSRMHQWSRPAHAQALVDAPGLTRHVETFKRLTLTDFKVEIPRLASKKVLTAAWTEAGERRGGSIAAGGAAGAAGALFENEGRLR